MVMICHFIFIIKLKISSVTGNLNHKLPTEMQTGFSVLEPIDLKCLLVTEKGLCDWHSAPGA